MRPFVVGDRVVMTLEALRLMGIMRAIDSAQTWSVTECYCLLCRSGRFVCTDQRAYNDNGWRHIAVAHLRREGEVALGELVPANENEERR